MSWQQWTLSAWYAASALLTIAWIGKPREPLTPGIAATTVAIYAGLATLVVTA